jgi:diadenosine tetraphosphate (Ap4A) HIT family hydrolase
MFVARALFALSKTRHAGRLVGLGFAHFARWIPARRVALTKWAIVFFHPRPEWNEHLLVVPRHAIASLIAMSTPVSRSWLEPLLQAASETIRQRGWAASDYALMANGGPRQEVGQVHFHLFRGCDFVSCREATGDVILANEETVVMSHACTTWQTHLVLRPRHEGPPLSHAASARERGGLLSVLPELDRRHDLQRRGYSLCIDERDGGGKLVAHIVAEKLRS